MAGPQQRLAVGLLGIGFALCLAVTTAGVFGFRLNLTPSYPRGLWQIIPKPTAYGVGDVVLVCPPVTAPFALGQARGYLPHGLCPDWNAPLIKRIAAVAGQRIDIGTDVRIDGEVVADTAILRVDVSGRPLPVATAGIIPYGHVFLLAGHPHSFDSRYFGSVPASGILGLARPVFVHDE